MHVTDLYHGLKYVKSTVFFKKSKSDFPGQMVTFCLNSQKQLYLCIKQRIFSVKILIVEDEISLADAIVSFLKTDGHICEQVNDYLSAEEKVSLYDYDCALIDINLPDGNGLNIIKQLKTRQKTTGIIIISARETVEDRIKGLETGADDYLVKPFDLAELNARIKSLIRRINFKGNNVIEAGEIKIFPDDLKVLINDTTLDLTKKEYDLLLFFVSNKNRVLTKETIAEHLWGDYIDTVDSFDFVYAHIKNLRKKLQKKGIENPIKTVYGLGYKFQ